MKALDLTGQARDIAWIARTYEKVLIDTSALQLSQAIPKRDRGYRSALLKASKKYQNIYTIREVFNESKLDGLNNPNNAGIQKIKRRHYEPLFTQFYNFLRPYALESDILDPKKASFQADLRLTSVAFAMSASSPERVAFLSSDRNLLDFVNEKNRAFRSQPQETPAQLQGSIIPYTLVQILGKFFSHTQDKRYRNFVEALQNGH
jgi:hypothetical protein